MFYCILLYYIIPYHTIRCYAKPCYAIYTYFWFGASTWPKASEPWAEEGAGFQFGCWHLAQSLRAPGQDWGAGSGPPSPAQGSEAPGQVPNQKNKQKKQKFKETKNWIF